MANLAETLKLREISAGGPGSGRRPGPNSKGGSKRISDITKTAAKFGYKPVGADHPMAQYGKDGHHTILAHDKNPMDSIWVRNHDTTGTSGRTYPAGEWSRINGATGEVISDGLTSHQLSTHLDTNTDIDKFATRKYYSK